VCTRNDEYGAIYLPKAAGDSTTATVKVDGQVFTSEWAKAGLMMRSDISKAGASPGYATISVSPSNGVAFQSDNDGNGFVDSSTGAAGKAPIWLRLVRDGSTVTGYSSTDGTTWTRVGSGTVPGAAASEDVGMFTTSHAAGTVGGGGFSGFRVSP
jgi:regulation of enolase protein 1 (concanavalin A-like superfamily)